VGASTHSTTSGDRTDRVLPLGPFTIYSLANNTQEILGQQDATGGIHVDRATTATGSSPGCNAKKPQPSASRDLKPISYGPSIQRKPGDISDTSAMSPSQAGSAVDGKSWSWPHKKSAHEAVVAFREFVPPAKASQDGRSTTTLRCSCAQLQVALLARRGVPVASGAYLLTRCHARPSRCCGAPEARPAATPVRTACSQSSPYPVRGLASSIH
jgi:hypothetical protein